MKLLEGAGMELCVWALPRVLARTQNPAMAYLGWAGLWNDDSLREISRGGGGGGGGPINPKLWPSPETILPQTQPFANRSTLTFDCTSFGNPAQHNARFGHPVRKSGARDYFEPCLVKRCGRPHVIADVTSDRSLHV